MKVQEFDLPKDIFEARMVQSLLHKRLIIQDHFGAMQKIAGIDVGYDVQQNLAHASVVVVDLEDLRSLEQVDAYAPSDFPYIPGFLSFREIPAILEALKKLSLMPDLLMVDGQGIAHPRRMGIAAHLGVHLDMPSIGVAKSKLTGEYITPGLNKGDCSPLMVGEEQIGVVLRSRDKVNPLFISPGHRVSIETAVDITLRCLTRYRLPEPTRLADKLSKCGKKAVELNTLFAVS